LYSVFVLLFNVHVTYFGLCDVMCNSNIASAVLFVCLSYLRRRVGSGTSYLRL